MFLRFSGKINDLFMLRVVLHNHWLQTRPATVHFQKASAALFVCHAKSSSTEALRLHHLSASSGYQGLGVLFECFRVTLCPHPFSKDLVKYPHKKRQTQHRLVYLQSPVF